MSGRSPQHRPSSPRRPGSRQEELPGLAFTDHAKFFVDNARLRRADRLSDRDEAVCTGLRTGLPPVSCAGDRRLGRAVEVLHDRVGRRRGPAVRELCRERLAAKQTQSQGREHAWLQTAETLQEHRGGRH